MEVALQILDGIASGATPLGHRLPADREMAAMMGVSRPTIREAFLALDVLGVLQVRAGDGTYVVHDGSGTSRLTGLISNRNFPLPAAEILEARQVVEPTAAAMAASRATSEQMDKLEALIDDAEDLGKLSGGLGPFVTSGLRFHTELAGVCGNSQIGTFITTLVDLEQNPMWVLLNAHALHSDQARKEQIAEHREILAAIRTRDGVRVSGLMADHLGHLSKSVEDLHLDTPDP